MATRYTTEKTKHPGVYRLLNTEGAWISTRVVYRDAAGKQAVKTFHGPNTIGAAKNWKESNVRFRDTSGRPDVVAGKTTLRKVYDEMVANAESSGEPYAPATLSLHGDVWKALERVDPKLEVTQVGKLAPARITGALSKISAPEMRSKARALLQRVGNFAVSRGYVQANFVEKVFEHRTREAKVQRRRLEAKPERMPSTEEVGRLAAALPERYRALVLVMAFEGLRPGEAFGLRVGDLDFKRGTLAVRRSLTRNQASSTKTGETRTLPMVPAPGMGELLQAHLERFGSKDPDAYVFTGETGHPIDSHNWSRRVFAPAARSAGVNDGISPNQLRHHAASYWIRKGANILQVSKLLGHSKPSITLDVYASLFSDDLLRLASIPAGLPELPAGTR
jgi:integrase